MHGNTTYIPSPYAHAEDAHYLEIVYAVLQQMAHQRKPRRCLSLVEKKTVLDDLTAGKPVVDVAGKLGISKSQVYTIRKNADSLKRTISKGDIPGSSKVSTNRSRYPSIDKGYFSGFVPFEHLRDHGNHYLFPEAC